MVRAYREYVDVAQQSKTFEGFAAETPLTLRFDFDAAPVWMERTPNGTCSCCGIAGTVASDRTSFARALEAAARIRDRERHPHESDRLVGITRDDPYVVDEDQIRFDAALLIPGPVDPPRPFTYRTMPAQMCVVHRHTGGAEQIAKTFAAIGVQWMPSEGWRLRCASPFEVHHVDQAVTGAARISHTHAYVPLEHRHHTHPEGAP
jgi:AraC family transcriptional regulator